MKSRDKYSQKREQKQLEKSQVMAEKMKSYNVFFLFFSFLFFPSSSFSQILNIK